MSRLCEKIEKLNDRLLLLELIEGYLRKQIGLSEDLFSALEKERENVQNTQIQTSTQESQAVQPMEGKSIPTSSQEIEDDRVWGEEEREPETRDPWERG